MGYFPIHLLPSSTRRGTRPSRAAMQQLRIVTLRFRVGDELTRPFRDARRFPSTRLYLVPRGYTHDVGVCPSFKDHSLSRRAKP
jgi:hypothetical protein